MNQKLTDAVKTLSKRTAAIEARRIALDNEIKTSELKVKESSEVSTLMEKVEILYKKILDQGLTQSFVMIEDLVTEGIATVYGNKNLRFRINPVERRGIYSVDISTINIVENIEGPTEDTFGGAVVQIEEFLLRIVFLLQTKMIPFMVLDESLNCVSEQYLSNLSLLLKEMCSRFNLDILLVTHQAAMREAADKVFNAVDKRDGKGLVLSDV